jgi:hypothetical protein
MKWIKPGEKIILEAFNPSQLKNNSGGPKNEAMLYTKEMLADDFQGLEVEIRKITQTELSEGKYHEGMAEIIRFIGVK